MDMERVVRIVVLTLLGTGFMSGTLISHGLGQPKGKPLAETEDSISATAGPQSCTVQSLLDTSNCDQTWSNYKSGYQTCVRDAAKQFWKEFACSDDALRKLQYSCRACEKQFRK